MKHEHEWKIVHSNEVPQMYVTAQGKTVIVYTKRNVLNCTWRKLFFWRCQAVGYSRSPHAGAGCKMGVHTNSGKVADMCPIFLENRNAKKREYYEKKTWKAREEDVMRTNKNRRARARAS